MTELPDGYVLTPGTRPYAPTPIEAPEGSPAGVEWFTDIQRKDYLFRGTLGGRQRLILGASLPDLVTMAQRMAAGLA